MTQTQLNIGLITQGVYHPQSIQTTLKALMRKFPLSQIIESSFHLAEFTSYDVKEPTLVILMLSNSHPRLVRDGVKELAKELQQESIALKIDDEPGELVFSKGKPVHVFNDEYFIKPLSLCKQDLK